MGIIKVVMPQLGESITTGTITKWCKKVGEEIATDEILFEVSTDKLESEIPSPSSGRLAKIFSQEGDIVDVGLDIAEIEDNLAAVVKVSVPTKTEVVESLEVVEVLRQQVSTEGRQFYTPLVRAMAQKHDVKLTDLENIRGSGTGGRVTKKDFEQYLVNPGEKNRKEERRCVSGTEIIPMDNMRKKIAENMVLSKKIAPHVNSIEEVDLTHLVKFRESAKEEFLKREGIKLTYTPFLCRAIIMALKEFPWVNASVEGENIILLRDINLGIAVALPEGGLIVPVIHMADTLNMLGLCRAIDSLSKKARNKKLTYADLTGGTFTFTNVGSFGTLMATPIILQPQSAIYAAGMIKKRPVVVEGDAIAVRSMMYGTHTYDHRIIDGEMGGRFLNSVHGHLAQMRPELLF